MVNSPLSRRSFLAGSGSVFAAYAGPTPTNGASVEAEQFGARGDGRADDAAALQQAIEAALKSGRALSLRSGSRYRIGSPGWRGLSADLNGGQLAIEGNGATLIVAATPRQRAHPDFETGAALAAKQGRLVVHGVNFDLGGLPAAGLAVDRCEAEITGCSYHNGERSLHSMGFFALRSSGSLKLNTGSRLGYLFLLGYTAPGMHVDGFVVQQNRASDLTGDFVVGVMKNLVVQNNECSGMFAGVAFSGYDKAGTYSENIRVMDNRFSGFRSHGIQSDMVGEIRARNVRITGNALSNGVGLAAGIYLVRVDDFVVEHNEDRGSAYGLVVEKAQHGQVRSNTFEATEGREIAGIVLAQDIGSVSDIELDDNTVTGYRTGIVIGGPRGNAQGVVLSQNRISSSEVGVRVAHGDDQVRLDANVLNANRRDFAEP